MKKLYPFFLLFVIIVLSACRAKQDETYIHNDNQIRADSTAPYRHPVGGSDTMAAYRRQWQTMDRQARRDSDVRDDTVYQTSKKLEIYMEAKTCIRAGRYDEAVEWYKRFENYSDNMEVLYLIAECYARKGDADNAFAFIDKYLDLLEKAVNEAASSSEEPTGFGHYYTKALMDPEFDNLHNDSRWKPTQKKASEFRDRILDLKKQYQDKVSKEAQASLEDLNLEIKRASKFAELYSVVDSLEQVKNFDQAIKVCKDVDDYQSSYLILYLLARIYAEKQDKDQAFTCLNEAFKIVRQSKADYHHTALVNYLSEGSYFDNLRNDPRWSDIEMQIKEVPNR